MYKLKLTIIAIMSVMFMHCSLLKKPKEVIILTKYGEIVIELYNETPKHRDNFLKLIEDSLFTDLLFHRTIKEFMIQGGDPDSKNAKPGQLLGEGGLNYTIPAEFHPKLFHKRGVLAAAREGDQVNPQKNSASTQFYIVHGKIFTEKELDMIEEKRHKALLQKKFVELKPVTSQDTSHIVKALEKSKFKYTSSKRKTYSTIGGAPHLDQNYTVFGEVKEGMEVVDKIANLPTDRNNRPLEDIRFTIITKNKNDRAGR